MDILIYKRKENVLEKGDEPEEVREQTLASQAPRPRPRRRDPPTHHAETFSRGA